MKSLQILTRTESKSLNSTIPISFDWREKNAVSPAKDQQITKCGSCYAFAVAAAIETAVAIKTKKLLDLSEQELVDCDLANYNITLPNNFTLGGCVGGSASNGIKYATKFGLFSETQYPYIAKNGTCRASCITGNKTFVKGITGPNPFTEDGFAQFIAQQGPLIIGFTVPKSMMSYSSGIMSLTPEQCAKESLGNGHVMVLVGYGIENGIPYFTLKNSFGPNWGENGFMRFKRGINFCNFNSYAGSPIY
uniref:Peptidase C1A papain C-terminal domain-containing protein n=1 Tax=Panagrolaimus sp. ES5 TaxID=591445 RepID=A0AC34GWQ3_9BILA